jgi:hypothetical protein
MTVNVPSVSFVTYKPTSGIWGGGAGVDACGAGGGGASERPHAPTSHDTEQTTAIVVVRESIQCILSLLVGAFYSCSQILGGSDFRMSANVRRTRRSTPEALFSAVTLVAGRVSTRRATTIDPLEALKCE